jgi:hypothetical protein
MGSEKTAWCVKDTKEVGDRGGCCIEKDTTQLSKGVDRREATNPRERERQVQAGASLH